MSKEFGTLKDLNLKEGDKVFFHGDTTQGEYLIVSNERGLKAEAIDSDMEMYVDNSHYKKWSIVSRAEDQRKLWGYMTDDEKGALLLAHYNGEAIQFYCKYSKDWFNLEKPGWCGLYSYRVKPKPEVKPVQVTAWVNEVDGQKDWSTLRKEVDDDLLF